MPQLLDASVDALIGVRLTSLTETDSAELHALLERACTQHQRIRLLLWFDDLSATEAADAWDALGLTNDLIGCIERLAVIGADWTGRLLEFAGRTGTYEGHHFEPHERDAAWRWLSGRPTPLPTWKQPGRTPKPTKVASVPGLPGAARS